MLLLAALCMLALATAQPYVPQVNRLTSCPNNGGTVVKYGNDAVIDLTEHEWSTINQNYYTPTVFNITQPGVTIHQMSLGVLNNERMGSVAHLRMGIFLQSGESGRMLAQTDEITLFPSRAQIIYANLLQPIALPIGSYQHVIWTDRSFVTGSNDVDYTVKNSAWSYYSPYGFPETDVSYYDSAGSKAGAVHGCQSSNDPMTAPGIAAHSICAYVQSILPATDNSTSKSQAATVTARLRGQIGVTSALTGSDNVGTWFVASVASLTLTITSSRTGWDQPTVTTHQLNVAPASSSRAQHFYPTGSSVVDAQGLVLVDLASNQYVLRYVNGRYQIDTPQRSIPGVYGSAMRAVTGTTTPSCGSSSNSYTPDTMSCPAGSTEVHFGDTDRAYQVSMNSQSSSTNILTGNWFFFHRFTVFTSQTEMRQLTMFGMDNRNRVVRMRLGLFRAIASNNTVTHQLVAQTREVVVANVNKQIIAVNLDQPIMLTQGLNYSIGVLVDQDFMTSSAYYVPNMAQSVNPYDYYLDHNGGRLPSSVIPTIANDMVMPLGGRGCSLQQSTRRFSMCATFVLDYEIHVYHGIWTALSTVQSSDKGNYVTVVDGRGVFEQRYDWTSEPTVSNWTFGKYNLMTNERIYFENSANPIDRFGLPLIVYLPWQTDGIQIASFLDPVSGSEEFTTNRQNQWSSGYVQFERNLVSALSIVPYNGGPEPACQALTRPVNSVTPQSSVHLVCPATEYQIPETYGDVTIGNYAVRADGTTINPLRIYTHTFVPASTGTISQLAVGLLRNTDRVGTQRVRLGLYSSAFSLLAQAGELQLIEAVDQLVIQDLATPITVTQGQTYYIALLSDSLLEVATSAQANSPSMTVASYSDAGLPATMTNTGNAVTVSVAAFACVQTTHSFCAWNQYSNAAGDSFTTFYTGLLQTLPTPTTDAYGTYVSVTAAGGFATKYRRESWGVGETTAVPFIMSAARDFHLYTASSNNQALDSTGLDLLINNVDPVTLAFVSRRNAVTDKNQDASDFNYVTSGFRATSLGQGIPNCNMKALPPFPPAGVAPPSCPSGFSSWTFGTAKESDLEYSNEGENTLYKDYAGTRTVRTGSSAVMIHQIKFGLNFNYNTVNKLRFAVFNEDMKMLAQSGDVTIINPTNEDVATGVLSSPVYVAPNSVAYIAVNTQFTIFAAHGAKTSPQWYQEYGLPWIQGVEPWEAGELALQAVGCTTSTIASGDSTSTSSKGVSDGAVAGIVIGCVIGTNLLLLACLWFFCAAGNGSKKGATQFTDENSRIESSRVEMSSA